MSTNVKGAKDLNLPTLPRKHYRRLPKGVQKFNMTVSVPVSVGTAFRKMALDSGRTASDLVAEAMHYWLDTNHPMWDIDEEVVVEQVIENPDG